MVKIHIRPHRLEFKSPILTSRGTMSSHLVWYIILSDDNGWGIGECAPLPYLSREWVPHFDSIILKLHQKELIDPPSLLDSNRHYPSIYFGLEQAILMFEAAEQPGILYPSIWTEGRDEIPINGLIWMGDRHHMVSQIKKKLNQGLRCLKLKIAALDWEIEYDILRMIRNHFPSNDLELRVDANGGFAPSTIRSRLHDLAELEVHSIEQPLPVGHWEDTAALCEECILPIALDEELIPLDSTAERRNMLETIRPQFLILKPTLIGGFSATDEWISLAQQYSIGWWITSALESNVGLNAIAQYTYTRPNGGVTYQGLGTGSLYTNNIISPLQEKNAQLQYSPSKPWGYSIFDI